MREYKVSDTWEFLIQVQNPGTGAAVDADSAPTWRLYLAGTDAAVDSGSCVVRDDGNTLGLYTASKILTGRAVGNYQARAVAIVGGVSGAAVIGEFRIVSDYAATASDIPAASDNAGAVLDALTADHDSAGTVGQAIGDAGAAAADNGPVPWTITADIFEGTADAAAQIWLTSDEAGTNIVRTAKNTDDAGQVTFHLDSGVTYWIQGIGSDGQELTAVELEVP